MPVSTETWEGQRALVLTGNGLRTVVLPEIGAKIISIRTTDSDEELVWRDPYRPLSSVTAGSGYGDNDASGIDDCFPTVDACPPGTPGGEDHGLVWSRSWQCHAEGDSILALHTSTVLPFQLERRMATTTAGRLRLDYRLSHTGGTSFAYLWTGHPLLRFDAGGAVELPYGAPARTAFATGDRLRAPSTWRWPLAPTPDGRLIDVSAIPENAVELPRTSGLNEKYWIAAPPGGCRLRRAGGRGTVIVEADPDQLPWLAVCVNYGGWPTEHPGFWVAVEPSTSPVDCLAEAARAGHARWLRPGDTHRWWWSLRFEQDLSTDVEDERGE